MSAFFPHARVVPIASASHWVTEDAADQVKKELTQFLGAP
jgi:pimeloyl-ACP methyl ester carboxylesterase